MARAGEHTEPSAARELRRLAWLFDDAILLPGGYRIGIDGIVGLVPGLGDALGLIAATWILLRARQFGVPRIVMARMLGNVVLDAAIGAIPVLGDLFDFAFKANRRNIGLMERYLTDERHVRRESWVRFVAALVLALLGIAVVLFLVFRSVQWLWNQAAV
ncbi:MAG TPA: DUF4112 domain-containing protein [Woeseiaceae bacterium]